MHTGDKSCQCFPVMYSFFWILRLYIHPAFTRMKNVYGLVSFGEYPAEVPLSVINEVKEQEKIFSMNLSLMNNSCLAKILLLADASKRGQVFADYVCNRKYDRLKMTAIKGKRKPKRNVLYLPTEVRVEVEKIAIEISFKRGDVSLILVLFSILLKIQISGDERTYSWG